jgi:hypothetical protein
MPITVRRHFTDLLASEQVTALTGIEETIARPRAAAVD